MPNMQLDKTPMPEQAPDVRNKNFFEVALGYTPEQAVSEAARCLRCKTRPCVQGCPVNVAIPEFVGQIADGLFDDAIDTVRSTNALPAVCGRVCPQETQCEQFCVRGKKGAPVAIGRLERFAADHSLQSGRETPSVSAEKRGKRVAVVGSGPAGLTCAGDLARAGYDVTVFEAFHAAGGVLVYGIPEFRLPKAIVKQEIDCLCELGVRIEPNMVIGQVFTVDDLFAEGYSAVFIGTGAGLPSFMNVPGESLIGVYSANEYLTRVNLMKAYDPQADTPVLQSRSTVVIGGGNVAMDAARCAKRMGAESVTIAYRRGEAELPARLEEIHHAKEEGIVFHFLTAPVAVHGDDDGRVCSMTCVEMELGEPDASGRRRPVVKQGSEFTLDADCVIVAIGTSPNPLIRMTTPGLEVNKWGCVVADEETGATSRPGVYAGGDIATGAATVILAMGAGKKAAAAIDRYLAG